MGFLNFVVNPPLHVPYGFDENFPALSGLEEISVRIFSRTILVLRV